MTERLEIIYLPVGSIIPDPRNPNRMSDEMFRKEIESIREFGFVDPIHVRQIAAVRYQLIDGEHRWKAAIELGVDRIPVIVLDVTEDEAAELSIVLNDLRGKPDEEKLATIVRDLAARRSMLDLERVLPYKRERLAEMVAERREGVDWEALGKTRPDPVAERWIERVYRFPASSVEVVDSAIGKVKVSDGVKEDWKALELICADYMAGD